MKTPPLDLERCREHILSGSRANWRGKVERVSGVLVEAQGVPSSMGELCMIERGPLPPIEAEVVGFPGNQTLLMPHRDLDGIGPQQIVTTLRHPFTTAVGAPLLGRALDGFGQPIDGGPELPPGMDRRRVRNVAPPPLSRKPIRQPLQTGVRAIDGLCTLGRGQRLGIFSGSGVGKSTLLGQITRGTDADVLVVALVGERGREVRSFLEDVLDEETRKKTVMVVATSDRPPIERYLAPFVAVTIAESFRDQHSDVLFVMDSITRFAAACREIGLAAGEPPTVRGYPPSFFATVPKLVERLGGSEHGSITGLMTVLLDADDPNEPVADTLRGLLDGHLFLSRDLAQQAHFPAIDVLSSLSRLMPEITSPEHQAIANGIRQHLAHWKQGRDLIEIGAYRQGTNPDLDRATLMVPVIDAFLKQETGDHTSFAEMMEMLQAIQGATPA